MYDGDTIDYLALPVTADPAQPWSSTTASPVSVGADVDGYYVESALGSGGQASLYLVNRAGNTCVLKIYHEGFQPLPEAVELLRRNECEYLAHWITSGVHAGRHYEVYRYYGSGSLDTLPPKPSFVDSVVVPCLDKALDYLHSHDLVHGDVKPGNVLVTADRSKVVLGDFGVATTLEARPARRMQFRGTLEYAPYGNRQGDWVSVDPAYDYGALGLTLVHAYTGLSLFAGLSVEERDARWLDVVTLPSSVPLRARPLLEGLLEKRLDLRWGHRQVEDWYTAAERPRQTSARRLGETTTLPHRVKGLDFGFYDGAGLTPASLPELDRAICAHWDGGIALLDNVRLKSFLLQFPAGSAAYDASRESAVGESRNARLFRLLCTLRSANLATQPLRYQTLSLTDANSLVKELSADYRPELGEFLTDGSLLHYLETIGLDATAIAQCRAAVDTRDGRAAAQNLRAIFGGSVLGVGDRRVRTVAELIGLLPSLDWDDLLELAGDEELWGWLYRNQRGDIAEKLRGIE